MTYARFEVGRLSDILFGEWHYKNPFNRGLMNSGRKDGIRTHDLLVPNQAHYQAVLLPVKNQITITDRFRLSYLKHPYPLNLERLWM